MLLAFFFRIWQLQEVPSGMLWDEGGQGLDVVPLFHGQFTIFFPGHSGHEPLLPYLQAGALKFAGWTPFALRLPAVFLTTLTVAASYSLGRRLFGPLVALLASTLMAASLWAVEFGRLGRDNTALPLFAALAGIALVDWLKSRRAMRSAVLCGLFTGLTLYTYSPGRFIVFVVGGAWLAMYVAHSERRMSLLRQGLAAAATALLVFLPLGVYYIAHPDSFTERAAQLSILDPEFGGPWSAWLQSVKATVLMFSFHGEGIWDKNIAGQPLFDPVISVLFVAGLITAVVRWRRFGFGLILLWLMVMVAPMTLTAKDLPDFGRPVGVAPVLFVFPALPAAWLWGRHIAWRAAIVAGLVGFVAVGYWQYFGVWANSPGRLQVYRPAVYDAGAASIARLEIPGGPARVYFGTLEPFDAVTDFLIAGFQIEHPGQERRLIGYDARQTHVLGPAGSESYLIQSGRPAIASLAPLPRQLRERFGDAVSLTGYSLPGVVLPGQDLTFQVQWQTGEPPGAELTFFVHVLDFGQQRTIAGIDQNGFPPSEWQGGETVTSTFVLPIAPDVPVGAYWVEFGAYTEGGRRLLTAAGNGRLLLGPMVVAAPVSTQPPIADLGQVALESATVKPTPSGYDVALTWLPKATLDGEYSVFVHLLDSSGKVVAQADGPPDQGSWPAPYWRPDVPVPDLHHLSLPAGLPAGSYRLAVGLYRLDNGSRLSGGGGPEPGSIAAGSITIG